MKILPNSFERYLASLRNFIFFCVLEHGIQRKHLEKLKKIQKAEAFFNKNIKQSIEISYYCENLLNAVAAFKEDFKFKNKLSGDFSVNKNLLTILLLEITIKNDFIFTSLQNGNLLIYFFGDATPYTLYTKALGGYSLKEIKNNCTAIIIPPTIEECAPVKSESEWDYLFNKFSIVNLYYKNL